jgi:hypothetical protein
MRERRDPRPAAIQAGRPQPGDGRDDRLARRPPPRPRPPGAGRLPRPGRARVYRELVEESGWTPDQFELWVGDVLERYAMGTPGPGRVMPGWVLVDSCWTRRRMRGRNLARAGAVGFAQGVCGPVGLGELRCRRSRRPQRRRRGTDVPPQRHQLGGPRFASRDGRRVGAGSPAVGSWSEWSASTWLCYATTARLHVRSNTGAEAVRR